MISKKKLHEIIEIAYESHKAEFEKLTRREKEVIQLWAAGKESKEIANMLNISKNTIDTHRKNIYKKTELKSMKDIVLFALAFDIL